MNREQIASKIRWPRIIWTFGLLNVTAMLPQLWKIVSTWEVSGLSLEMFVLYFLIQCAFSAEGFFTRNRMLIWCLGLSALVSAVIIMLIVHIRYF